MAEEPRHPGWSTARLLRDAQAWLARNDFVHYIRAVAPWFVIEYAHVAIARHLEALVWGQIDRLQIAMAPRTGKSLMTSELLPSFWYGWHPSDKVMAGGHTIELQRDFGFNVQALIASEAYQSIFPGVHLVSGRLAAGNWAVRGPNEWRDGSFLAFGTGKRIAGRGFNLGTLDDPTSEQDKDSDDLQDKVERWYRGGFYTRRQPERNAILITATRWRHDDLSGRLLEKAASDAKADQWEVLNIPALLTKGASIVVKKFGETDPDTAELPAPQPYVEGNEDKPIAEQHGSFLPIRMPLKELLRSKNNMSTRDWDAQYMGEPSSEEGAILKRKWWRAWPKGKKLPEPGKIVATLTFLDTAFEEDEEADYSAATTWHIFEITDAGRDQREYQHYHALLAGAWQAQVDTIDLYKTIKSEIIDVFRPDKIIVEKRASGIQLIQEMRRKRMPVRSWLPPGPPGAKGKRPRAYASQVVFEQGGIHYVKYHPVTGEELPWAKMVIDQCAKFPFAKEKDLVDTVTMACIYLRRHYWLGLPDDEETEEEEHERKVAEANKPGRRLYGGVETTPGTRGVKPKRKLYG